MKKPTLALMLCTAIVCFLKPPSFAATYTIQQITNSNTGNYKPQINASGQVVWYGYYGTSYEIFLYDPSTGITQLTTNNTSDTNPRINDIGQVVWEGYDGTDYEVFFYNPSGPFSGIYQITNNSYHDWQLQISNCGVVYIGNSDLYTFSTGIYPINPIIISSPYNQSGPEINDICQVAWINWNEKYPTLSDIWLRNWGQISPVDGPCNDCDVPDGHYQIADTLGVGADGHYRIVWARGVGANTEIFLWDYYPVPGVVVKQISSIDILYENRPRLPRHTPFNRSPTVTQEITNPPVSYVWPDILLYDITTDTTTTVLNSPGPGGQCAEFGVFNSLEINASGQVVFDGNVINEIFLASPASEATPVGTNIVSIPIDTTTGGTPVTVAYSNVTEAGVTTLTTTTDCTSSSGFQLGDPPTCYDIDTTATFSGNVQICI
jgi:hypothetical protein